MDGWDGSSLGYVGAADRMSDCRSVCLAMIEKSDRSFIPMVEIRDCRMESQCDENMERRWKLRWEWR